MVDAVRCAIEVQNGLIERNAGVPPDRRIEFRVGIHLGDVVEESDGDLMGDGVNIAARLEGIAKPGAICLSEDAYRQVKGRLDLAVTRSRPDRSSRTSPSRSGSIRCRSASPRRRSLRPRRSPPAPKAAFGARAARRAAIVALLVAGSRAAAWLVVSANRRVRPTSTAPAAEPRIFPSSCCPSPISPAIPSQDYFADGVTENLTTDLSRIRDSFVIARNTAFTYKGKNVDAKEIGKELGVRYVLEGSVQRDQNRVRVNAQLIDAESGAHLWADRFEEDVADLFKLQDEVVARLANALRVEIWHAEARRLRLQEPGVDRFRHAGH